MKSRILLILLLSYAPFLFAQEDATRWFRTLSPAAAPFLTIADGYGRLVYDWVPTAPPNALTRIGIGVEGQSLVLDRQNRVAGAMPVLSTVFQAGPTQITTETFSLSIPSKPSTTPVTRLDGAWSSRIWARPPLNADPAFQGVAWSNTPALRYEVRIPQGERRKVAFGLCEGFYTKVGERMLVLQVEGGYPLHVDLLSVGRKDDAQVFFVTGQDVNHDGRLGIEVQTENHAPPILSGFWVFPESAQWTRQEVVQGMASTAAEYYVQAGHEPFKQETAAVDVIIARFEGESAAPLVRISSPRALVPDLNTGVLSFQGIPFLQTKPKAELFEAQSDGLILHYKKGITSLEIWTMQGKIPAPKGLSPHIALQKQQTQNVWQQALKAPTFLLPETELQAVFARHQHILAQADLAASSFSDAGSDSLSAEGLLYNGHVEAAWQAFRQTFHRPLAKLDAWQTQGRTPHQMHQESAAFVRFITQTLFVVREDTQHLFLALPMAWFKPQAKFGLQNQPSSAGLLSVEVQISADGKTATLQGKLPPKSLPTRLYLHGFTAAGFSLPSALADEEEVLLTAGKPFRFTFKRN